MTEGGLGSQKFGFYWFKLSTDDMVGGHPPIDTDENWQQGAASREQVASSRKQVEAYIR